MSQPLPSRTVSAPLGALLLAALLPACQADLGPRAGQTGGSFGAIVYREVCQRVSYSTDLEARERDPRRPLDASGAAHRGLCSGGGQAGAEAAPALRALTERRDDLIRGVDGTAPEPLLDSLDAYLQALAPLQEDGTVPELLARAGRLLQQLAADDDLTRALGRLSQAGGLQPPESAGGVPRSIASAPALDDVIGATLPLLVPGGAARGELEALLRALAFELRHLEAAPRPGDPERTEALLRDLMLTPHPAELGTGQAVPLALRDHRGLPMLKDVVPPYVPDPQSGLARADDDGRFVDSGGAPIPYVSPLPELGKRPAGARDAQGRALRGDGQPLYRYTDLDSTLLMALLRDASRLLSERNQAGAESNIPFGLLRGAALLSGTRDSERRSMKGAETLRYRAFVSRDAVLLDLAHGALQILRYRGGTDPAQDLVDLLSALRWLMAPAANEDALARALKALLDAADEAKRPAYDGARIPAESTLYDDLAPVLARLFAAPPRRDATGREVTLIEDIIEATDRNLHPEGTALGAIAAQLLDERGYFFMRQPLRREDLNTAGYLDPADRGTVGSFTHRPDRAAPDADPEPVGWAAGTTDQPRNNRSVMQRLLHLVAETNGRRPLCNGRNARIAGYLFEKECDLFQVDNVARFFLLSIASPPLRAREDTFAKPAASFWNAIQNGRVCRAPANMAEQATCRDLTEVTLPDDPISNDRMQSIMGVVGFGLYPEPPAAARALFLDLQKITLPSFAQTRRLLLNHLPGGELDLADPDSRQTADSRPGDRRLMIDEFNGILFALEAVRGRATLPDGTTREVNFYEAMRPLVDAFAKHYECLQRNVAGACVRGHNAVQILADAMTVLHRHWPSARSQVLGRGFLGSYGAQVSPDGVVTYEPLAARVLAGDLLPAVGDLAPIWTALTTDGQAGGPRALPVLARVLRYVFDPSQAQGLALRDGRKTVTRNDDRPAYQDETLEQVLGSKQDGKPTLFYLLAEALRKKRAVFARPDSGPTQDRWDRAVSDAVDAFLKVQVERAGTRTRYRFDNPRLRGVSAVVLDFLRGRVQAHRGDLPGWSQQLLADLDEVLSGPLYAALLDLGVKLDDAEEARRRTYALLRQILDEQGGALVPLAAAAADATQLLLDDGDLLPMGRALAGALDLGTGPIDPGLLLARRGRELEQASPKVTERPMLVKLLRNLYRPEPGGIYPAHRLGEVIAEVNRETPGAGGAYRAADHRALLSSVGGFLLEQQRGLPRFITIVQKRRLQ